MVVHVKRHRISQDGLTAVLASLKPILLRMLTWRDTFSPALLGEGWSGHGDGDGDGVEQMSCSVRSFRTSDYGSTRLDQHRNLLGHREISNHSRMVLRLASQKANPIDGRTSERASK